MANYLCHSPVERLYILPNLHVGRSNGSIDSDRVSPLGENHGGIASHHHQSDAFLIANSEYGKQHASTPRIWELPLRGGLFRDQRIVPSVRYPSSSHTVSYPSINPVS